MKFMSMLFLCKHHMGKSHCRLKQGPFLKSHRTINVYKTTAYIVRRMAKAGNGKSPGKKNGAKARHI